MSRVTAWKNAPMQESMRSEERILNERRSWPPTTAPATLPTATSRMRIAAASSRRRPTESVRRSATGISPALTTSPETTPRVDRTEVVAPWRQPVMNAASAAMTTTPSTMSPAVTWLYFLVRASGAD